MSGVFSLFLYGRTKAADYRWLLKPTPPLESGFIATALELNQRKLFDGNILYYYNNFGGFAIFCVLFTSKHEVDERGRPISFAVGISCEKIYVRELNYRLPALICEANRFTQECMGRCVSALTSDSLPLQTSFDLKSYAPDYSFLRQMKNSEDANVYGADGILLRDANNLNLKDTNADGIVEAPKNSIPQSEIRVDPRKVGGVILRDCVNSGALLTDGRVLMQSVETPKMLANFGSKGAEHNTTERNSKLDQYSSNQQLLFASNSDRENEKIGGAHTNNANEANSSDDKTELMKELESFRTGEKPPRQPEQRLKKGGSNKNSGEAAPIGQNKKPTEKSLLAYLFKFHKND